MRVGPGASFKTGYVVRSVAAAAAVSLGLVLGSATETSAQAATAATTQGQMLLEADTLIYDDDTGTITAAGGVRIDYNGTRLVADRVIYERRGNRLRAQGGIEIIDPDGNKLYGDEINLSDDLRDGFINTLRVETSARTFFASESGERVEGNITTFNSGVYTACEPCEEKPDKPPIWRIRAARIIWNGKEKIVRFERTRFELFGFPIAYFRALELPDHTVKRKSGFLFPGLKFASGEVGFGVSVPYYFALSPTYDLTATVTGLHRQGFLTELEWRQRFNSGTYSIRAAGIYQLQPSAFPVGTHGAANTFRGLIGTTGAFNINPRWRFGWYGLLQSDENFGANYIIPGYTAEYYSQNVYLTGLNDRNFFDLQAHHYKIQEATTGPGLSETLPYVLPIFDYTYTVDRAVAGGELRFDANAENFLRSGSRTLPTALIPGRNFVGVQGSHGRFTAEVEWRKQIVAPGGLVLTPMLSARGDAIYSNLSAVQQAAISGAMINGVPVPTDLRSGYFRGMATAGLEARWPILMATRNTTHVIEPVGQIFIRPDAPFDRTLSIPNEDAQSMVFDTANLFERDKFSGYDEMEGGIRANIGARYTGTFGRGWMLSAIAGQSFHLAGLNSYGTPSYVNAGAFSGLETARSDYVASATIVDPKGRQLLVGGRFDETTLAVRRADVRASGTIGRVSASLGYAFIQAQPLYGYPVDRHQISASTTARVADHWRLIGSATYDIQNANLMSTSLGFSYDDECFGFTLTASQGYGAGNVVTSQSFGVQISFRTIGDFGGASGGSFGLGQ